MLNQALAKNAALHEGGTEMQRSLLMVERVVGDQRTSITDEVHSAYVSVRKNYGTNDRMENYLMSWSAMCLLVPHSSV